MAPVSGHRLLPHIRELARSGDVGGATDGQLLEWFLTRREEAAFRALVDRHGPMVMGVCRRVLGDAHDAEDVFQATFLVLVCKAASVVPRESLANWLYGVACRTAHKARVARARADAAVRRAYDRGAAMAGQARADAEVWHDLRPVLDQELQRLPDTYRVAVVLCDLEGVPRKDAARRLGWPEGTLSGRLARARQLLAERLTRRGVTLSAAPLAAALAQGAAPAAVPAALKASLTRAAALIAGGGHVPAGVVSARVAALTEGVMKTMLLARLRVGVLVLAAAVMAATGTGLVARQVTAPGGQQPSRADGASPNPAERTRPADEKAQPAGAEMHVIGVYGAKEGDGGTIEVEVRPTPKPVVLVLTAYYSVDWRVKLADRARIKQVVISGYNAQEVHGVPADVPVVNRSYYPGDGSRRKEGWFWADRWDTPQWREMVRRLNDLTGLPAATFQGANQGASFIVDGSRGREFGQKELKPRAPAPKEPTPQEVRAAAAGAELHVVSVSDPRVTNPTVEVRAAAGPVVLALTSSMQAAWTVKPADGARIKAVLVGGSMPQEVDGLPAGVPVLHCCPDPSSFFDRGGGRRGGTSFHADRPSTLEYRRMVEQLNDLTGLLLSTFQVDRGDTPFVVDGARGREFAQKERKPRWTPPKEPTPRELLAACAGAELQVVGLNRPRDGNGAPVDVEVRRTDKPVVLVLTSYHSVLWNVKIADGARVKAVILGGWFEQELEGVPAGVPIVYRASNPSGRQDYFWGYKVDTFEYRRMVDRLNDLTGLLVATYQGEYQGSSFVIDGTRGREFAQKERKPRWTIPPEPTRKELLAASAGAELHVVGIYQPGGGTTVDVEVRPTDKPIVLALASYMEVRWNVKIAAGARVKAVIVGGWFEQELEGLPKNIPVVYRAANPSRRQNYFYAYKPDTIEYRRMVDRLNDLTGLLASTAQLEYRGSSFVVDGARGRVPAPNPPKEPEDPLADVADVSSRDLQAAGDPNKRYFLIGPKKDARPPARGYGLVVVLPGGDGGADFNPFVRRVFKNALPDGYVAAQPVAVKWTRGQQIVWPTKTNPVAGMKFGTEEFVEAVIADVAKTRKLDRTRVFTLAWSSSGPAAYATSLQEKRGVTGSLIAMSVFDPKFLPPLTAAKGHAYFLYHSPADRVCPYRMAERAKSGLAENGATVRLATYDGGHGWRGDVYTDIRGGVEWLERNGAKAGGP
jgi:RNA polymerase sigma factor (sigma-70 family)